MTKNLEEAFKVAITVDQAELQEPRDQAFHARTQGPEYRQADRPYVSSKLSDNGGQRT
jgi:hypothetical protein